MTRADAEEQAEKLQAEHPDRHYAPRERADGTWEVASIEIPEQLRREPLKETIDASPQPSPAEDPRTGHERRIPGAPGGLG
jgi:hypothetical protein